MRQRRDQCGPALVSLACGVAGACSAAAYGQCDLGRLVAPWPTEVDQFGITVAMSGHVAVAGAIGDDTLDENAGAAYAYRLNLLTGLWDMETTLLASDGGIEEGFGQSVAVDGDSIVVGAPFHDDLGIWSGAAYVFAYDGAQWSEQQKLLPDTGDAGDIFGWSVDVDGARIIVGARLADADKANAGRAYIFEFDGAIWSQTAVLSAPGGAGGDEFGVSVAIDGARAVVGASKSDSAEEDAGAAFVYERTGDGWEFDSELTASDAVAGDEFGGSVDIHGATIIVGARFNDVAGEDAGAAYVYDLEGGFWTETTILHSPRSQPNDLFGCAVAVHASTVLVGATGDDELDEDYGAAHIFQRTDDEWSATGAVVAIESGPQSDFGVALALEGDRAFVGAALSSDDAFQTGSAYLFGGVTGIDCNDDGVPDGCEVSGTSATLTPSDDPEGDSSAPTHMLDDVAVIGSPLDDQLAADAGAAYIFRRTDGEWVEELKLFAFDGAMEDRFGTSVALGTNTLIVGTPLDDDQAANAGAAYVYLYDTEAESWGLDAKIFADDPEMNDRFGTSVFIWESNWAIVGSPRDDDAGFDSGSAYIFRKTGQTWSMAAKVVGSQVAAGDLFGTSVQMNGDRIVVGAHNDDELASDAGAAYVFHRDGSVWNELGILRASDGGEGDRFGRAVAMDSETVIVGAENHSGKAEDAGAAYIFDMIDDAWTETAQLLASDAQEGDHFGSSVAIDGETAIVGARNGDAGAAQSGAAYVYESIDDAWQELGKLGADSPTPGDQYGDSVSIQGIDTMIGAPGGASITAHFLTLDPPADCNENGVPDECDIASGDSTDIDRDGVPDECEGILVCATDLDGDDVVAFGDLLIVLDAWGPCGVGPACAADLDDDGTVGFGDLLLVLDEWGPCA